MFIFFLLAVRHGGDLSPREDTNHGLKGPKGIRGTAAGRRVLLVGPWGWEVVGAGLGFGSGWE